MINIQIDSRKVQKNDTFIAIKGKNYDGHNYINEAIKRGANKIIAEYGEYEVPYEIVKNTKAYLENYLTKKYQSKINKLIMIGITGTNGKTTTAYITNQLLNILNLKTAYIGTLGFYINKKLIKELDNTTPDLLSLYKLILESINFGCQAIVMEVSSHALVQNRLHGIDFNIAAFTNLTQDHLDFHENMENYLNAKKIILTKLKEKGRIIVNADDKYSNHFITKSSITIGKNGKDYHFKDIKLSLENSIINFSTTNSKNEQIKINLTSLFNVYNYMTSLAIVKELGYSLDEIYNISHLITSPKGRCETIKYKNNIIVIDYAHTPDAVEKIINNYKTLTSGEIITIIGCGGNRDPKKRPLMAEIATKLSNRVIFTNDNPRNENPKKIILDMIYGVAENNFQVEYDRFNAIKNGIDLLNEKDVLLILGKGHEDYQIIGNEKLHFDDVEEVQKILKNT